MVSANIHISDLFVEYALKGTRLEMSLATDSLRTSLDLIKSEDGMDSSNRTLFSCNKCNKDVNGLFNLRFVSHAVAIASAQKNKGSLEAESIVLDAPQQSVVSVFRTMPSCSVLRVYKFDAQFLNSLKVMD
ncbi:hypothetical protein Tco_1028585 [Tanacetum coccineum]|uniref:Uncharacterized protein n=1 Tax=Tanacetum coccineum TaxID=301880 RepID=A0ABQ5G1G5_9ASTR